MNKEEILAEIDKAASKDEFSSGRNSMGASENYYDCYFSIGKCFSASELQAMSLQELNNLIKLAELLSEAFY